MKDKASPKIYVNIRLITLVCLFRKLFESVLLTVFDDAEKG